MKVKTQFSIPHYKGTSVPYIGINRSKVGGNTSPGRPEEVSIWERGLFWVTKQALPGRELSW